MCPGERNELVCRKKNQSKGRVKTNAKANLPPPRQANSCARKWNIPAWPTWSAGGNRAELRVPRISRLLLHDGADSASKRRYCSKWLTSANQPRVARTGNRTVKKYDNWKTTSRREAEYQEGG